MSKKKSLLCKNHPTLTIAATLIFPCYSHVALSCVAGAAAAVFFLVSCEFLHGENLAIFLCIPSNYLAWCGVRACVGCSLSAAAKRSAINYHQDDTFWCVIPPHKSGKRRKKLKEKSFGVRVLLGPNIKYITHTHSLPPRCLHITCLLCERDISIIFCV